MTDWVFQLLGGGAETARIADIARKTLNLPVRVATPKKLDGLASDIDKPSFATSIGLLLYGVRQGGSELSQGGGMAMPNLFGSFSLSTIGQKLAGIIKSVMP